MTLRPPDPSRIIQSTEWVFDFSIPHPSFHELRLDDRPKGGYVVTGAASGIGAATKRHLEERGERVIGCDLHDADVIADLTTPTGRSELIAGVTRLSGGNIDAIVANAGGGPPETSLSLNFFGAVATLDGLRPLLRGSAAPRAVAVSSIASPRPPHDEIVAACLRGDESTAIAVQTTPNSPDR